MTNVTFVPSIASKWSSHKNKVSHFGTFVNICEQIKIQFFYVTTVTLKWLGDNDGWSYLPG